MKRCFILIYAFVFLFSSKAIAGRYDNEYVNYGVAAGASLACGNKQKVSDYNLIIGWIIHNTFPSESARSTAMLDYATAMKRAYNRQKAVSPMPCSEVNFRFNQQPIFKTEIKPDGTLIMPDGKILKSRVKPSKKVDTAAVKASSLKTPAAKQVTKQTPQPQSKTKAQETLKKNTPQNSKSIKYLSPTIRSGTRVFRYGSIKNNRK